MRYSYLYVTKVSSRPSASPCGVLFIHAFKSITPLSALFTFFPLFAHFTFFHAAIVFANTLAFFYSDLPHNQPQISKKMIIVSPAYVPFREIPKSDSSGGEFVIWQSLFFLDKQFSLCRYNASVVQASVEEQVASWGGEKTPLRRGINVVPTCSSALHLWIDLSCASMQRATLIRLAWAWSTSGNHDCTLRLDWACICSLRARAAGRELTWFLTTVNRDHNGGLGVS